MEGSHSLPIPQRLSQFQPRQSGYAVSWFYSLNWGGPNPVLPHFAFRHGAAYSVPSLVPFPSIANSFVCPPAISIAAVARSASSSPKGRLASQTSSPGTCTCLSMRKLPPQTSIQWILSAGISSCHHPPDAEQHDFFPAIVTPVGLTDRLAGGNQHWAKRNLRDKSASTHQPIEFLELVLARG